MACSYCGKEGHNVTTCPYANERVDCGPAESATCECCGKRRDTVRHHTRGRGSCDDYLDVCRDCHLTCCHEGNWQNLGIKPRICRITGKPSAWRP